MNSGASDFCHVRPILPGCSSDFWERNFPISLSDFVQCDVCRLDAYINCWTAKMGPILAVSCKWGVSDITIWIITLELSVTILEVSFTLIYDIYSAGITYDANRNMFIVQAPVYVFQRIVVKIQWKTITQARSFTNIITD